MKKLLTLGLLASLSFPAWSEYNGDLLINSDDPGSNIYVLGQPKTWTGNDGAYTFDPENNDHKLSKLVQKNRNTDNVFIFPEGQNGEFNTDENKAIGMQGFYVDMGKSYKIESVQTTWEGAFATAYDIYFTNSVPSSESSLSNPAIQATGQNGTEQTVTLTSNNEGQYLVFVGKDATNWGWGCKIRSISAYGDTKSVTGLTVSQGSVPQTKSTTVTVTPVNVIGDALDFNTISNLSLSCDVPSAVTITAGNNGTYTVKGNEVGTYTLTATASYNGQTVTGSSPFYVTFNWETEPNVAAGKKVYYRWNTEKDATANIGDNVTDNSLDTYYEYNGDWGGGNGWIVIDLGDTDHVINAIEVYFNGAEANVNVSNNTFQLYFGTSEATFPQDNSDIVWKEENFSGWEKATSTLVKGQNTYVSYVLSDDEKKAIRYIGYYDTDNPKGKPQIAQIYVAGVEMNEPSVATSIFLSAMPEGLVEGESFEPVYSVKDQYGADFQTAKEPTVTVSGNATFEEGKVVVGNKGNFNVKVSYENLSNAADGKVIADMADYCAANAIVTTDTNAQEPENAIDGGAEINKNGNDFVIAPNEPAGAVDHWMLVKLARPYKLDLIVLNWEGACPADYDVYLGSTEDNLSKVYSVTGHTQKDWSDRFFGQDMNNVQYIKVVTTANATGYGLKLHDIKAYGVQTVSSVPTSISTLSLDKDYVANDEKVTVSGSLLDQFGGPMDGELKYYIDGNAVEGNEVNGEKSGVYNITAKYGEFESAPVKLHVVANDRIRLTDEDALCMMGDEIVKPFSEVVYFGEEDSEEWEPLEVIFDAPMYFDLIRLDWEAACPKTIEISAQYNFENTEVPLVSYDDRAFVLGVHPDDRLVNSSTENFENFGKDYIYRTNLSGITKLIIQPLDRDHGYKLQLQRLYAYGSADASATDVKSLNSNNDNVDVINLQGMVVKRNVNAANAIENLPKGIYIIGGKKVVVR